MTQNIKLLSFNLFCVKEYKRWYKREMPMECNTALMICFKVDPGNTGRVGPTEAALFLKKSGLPDLTLGKVGNQSYTSRNSWLWLLDFYQSAHSHSCASVIKMMVEFVDRFKFSGRVEKCVMRTSVFTICG